MFSALDSFALMCVMFGIRDISTIEFEYVKWRCLEGTVGDRWMSESQVALISVTIRVREI